MNKLLLSAMIALLVMLPVGFALGQEFAGTDAGRVPAADCPEAAEAMESAGVKPDYFSPGCPTDAELNDLSATEPPSAALVEGCHEFLQRNPDAPSDHMCVQVTAAGEK